MFVEKIISIFGPCLTLSLCVCLAMPDKCAHDSCTAYCIVSLSGSSSKPNLNHVATSIIHAASIAVLPSAYAKRGYALESPSAFYSPGHAAKPVPSCSAGTATAFNPEKQQNASAASASREEGPSMAQSTNGGNKSLLGRGLLLHLPHLCSNRQGLCLWHRPSADHHSWRASADHHSSGN